MKPENIKLHTEELVLWGLTPGDRYTIGDVREREIAHRFTEPGAPPSLQAQGSAIDAIERLGGGLFEVKLGSRAAAIGLRVAQAAYRGLNR